MTGINIGSPVSLRASEYRISHDGLFYRLLEKRIATNVKAKLIAPKWKLARLFKLSAVRDR